MKTAQIGTISEGTLRTEDLINTFMDFLEEHKHHHVEEMQVILDTISREEEDMSLFLNEDIWDAMNDLAPSYCFFGPHEGDGACFGFWPDWELINDSIHDKDLLKVSDLSEIDKVGDSIPSTVLLVNDHGNATLYDVVDANGNVKEIWSCV